MKLSSSLRGRSAVCLLCLITLPMFATETAWAATPSGAIPGSAAAVITAKSQTPDITATIAKVTPSVVAIIGNAVYPGNEGTAGRYDLGHGTGIIVKSDGVIMTNAHVVKNMRNLTVVTSDGKSYPAKTTHYDEDSDLALVKIEATGLPAAVFAPPSSIRVGESVIAIGTPVSFSLRNSVTLGIVSGINRSVSTTYQLLQTDAAINPGNSGGPLVNLKGEVVGVTSLKYADIGVDSLGFAIPSDTAQYVLSHFLTYGKVRRPYLGVELEESWEAVVGLPSRQALSVTYVEPGTPAAKAGIRVGDQLAAVGSSPVGTLVELNEALKKYLPGQTVELTVLSGGKETKRSVVLGEQPADTSWQKNDDSASLNPDAGKTRIGDSKAGWSMNYPSGLILLEELGQQNRVVFADAKEELSLSVEVEPNLSRDISSAGLLRKLAESASQGTILEKRYVADAVQPYAKLVSQTESGTYVQTRAFVKEDKLYKVTLRIADSSIYKNKGKLNGYLELLNSFKLSFDKADSALKDLRQVKKTKPVKSDFGLSFEIPSDWENMRWSSGLMFIAPDYDQSLSVTITSAEPGDTAARWAERQEQLFRDTFADAYRKIGGRKNIDVNGTSAVENTFSYKFGDEWLTQQIFYVIKGKYKYLFEFRHEKESGSREFGEVVRTVTESIRIDKERVSSSAGYIQDDDDMTDPNRTATYLNSGYKYSVKIPETWWSDLGDDSEDVREAEFGFLGGNFYIEVDSDTSFEEKVSEREKKHKQNRERDKDYVYKTESVSVKGVNGKKFTVTSDAEEGPYRMTEYVFAANGITYTVTLDISEAVRTEVNEKRLNQAFESLTLLP